VNDAANAPDPAPSSGSGNAPGQRATQLSGGIALAIGLLCVSVNLRMGVTSVGPLLPDIQGDLGMSPTVASLLTTIPVFAFGAFAFLTPSLLRRLGAGLLLAIVLAAIALGIAVRLVPSVPVLFAGTVLVGAGIAIGNVLIPAGIKRRFAERTALMTALHSTVLSVCAGIAAASSVPLMQAFGGAWQPALAVWAVPAVAALIVWLPQVRALPRAASSEAPQAPRALSASTDDTAAELVSGPSFARLVRDPVAIAVTLFMGLQSLGFYTTVTWFPAMFQEAGFSPENAGLLVAYAVIPSILGTLFFPVIARRLRATWIPVAVSSALLGVSYVGLLVAPTSLALVWMTLMGISQGATLALALTYIVLRSPDAAHTGHVSTLAQGAGYLIAGLGPVLFALVHTLSGEWAAPLWFLLVVLVLQTVFGLAACRDRHVLDRARRR